MTDKIRAFIAIEIPETLRAALGKTRDALKLELSAARLRWPPVENIHLTLKFLGDILPDDVERIGAALRVSAESLSRFEIRLAGLGVFPKMQQPRVFWLGVEAPPELATLQRGIEVGCAGLGFPPERRAFSPHLTLARFKRGANRRDYGRMVEVLEAHSDTQVGAAMVNEVILFQSTLAPQGASYSRLYSVQFM
jgi:2'-5' RNA ligase